MTKNPISTQLNSHFSNFYKQQNRQNIILPFDSNRVVLSNRPNDYINCSRVQTGSSALPVVLAGEIAPHPEDLWSLIWNEKV